MNDYATDHLLPVRKVGFNPALIIDSIDKFARQTQRYRLGIDRRAPAFVSFWFLSF
ncbi:hypothetical protein CHELA1G11_11968 [Hyphomicrobiales bacterium]|nr:hypothetical protein CHELA1G11_11968 [Hyphomicrobiales bacterium]CAH1664209.1 hypothetical protein CHELA1G2_12343 [Hyphomicrobiales bacterium]